MRTDWSTRRAELRDARLGEPLDLLGEARQRMARDVEAERVLLAVELLVERPLRQVREIVAAREPSSTRRAAEEIRLAELRLLAPPRGPGERPLRRRGERRAVLPERVERARPDQRVERALVDQARVHALGEVGEGDERPPARARRRIECAAASPDALDRRRGRSGSPRRRRRSSRRDSLMSGGRTGIPVSRQSLRYFTMSSVEPISADSVAAMKSTG